MTEQRRVHAVNQTTAADWSRKNLRRRMRHRALALVAAALGVAAMLTGPLAAQSSGAPGVPGSPIGVAEHMVLHPGGVRFIGWTHDTNRAAPINVYITVDGHKVATVLANVPRPDIAARYPLWGPNHGFDTTVLIPEGPHTLCVVAQNILEGSDTTLRCLATTLDYGPVGVVDGVSARPGSIYTSGWVLDKDAPTEAVTVSVIVDGYAHTYLADRSRSDVVSHVSYAGTQHGFAVTIPASQGTHQVCVKATNIGYGSDNTLACQSVTLAESPQGAVDTLGQSAGKLRATGWAFDPDAPTAASTVNVSVDGVAHYVTANLVRTDVASKYPQAGSLHGFDTYLSVAEGTHTVCVIVNNVSYGSNKTLTCRSVVINSTPSVRLYNPLTTATGIFVAGYATDPDTSAPVSVRLTSGSWSATVLADHAGTVMNGHRYSLAIPMTSGTHTVCAVALNLLYGTHDSAPQCQTVTLALAPFGHFDSAAWNGDGSAIAVTGWALDPDTTAPISVSMTLDGASAGTVTANASRSDVAAAYPAWGAAHGVVASIPAVDGEHTVCLTARNVGGGTDTSLGCKLIAAESATAPSAPTGVVATPDYGQASVSWTLSNSDGGTPITQYVVTASPGGSSVTVSGTTTSAVVTGLSQATTYSFSVTAVNAVGSSPAAVSNAVLTPTGPAPQTTPAPISTSRYTRNLHGISTDLTTMNNEGYADAQANPSGHKYLILLDIGGQDQYDGGVVLSATTRFVSYGNLVSAVKAYVDGYHRGQRSTAPVVIAVGTNNDMDVSSTSGAAWATQVVNPLVSYAHQYANMTIAGANDIEPGFRATYTATRYWLQGYLGATSAPFVFNGSADGCAWSYTNSSCNNGWTMAGLYYLGQGAAPTRTINLPQVYNYTMADQWKWISLTGVVSGQSRVNFGGPLTEWTACSQAGSCGSLTGNSAWSRLWSDLQSDSRLKVSTLPYSTDLRIDW